MFEQLVPELEAALEGKGDISQARLAYLYRHLQGLRALKREEWPAGVDFARTIGAIHDLRAARGYDAGPFAEADWQTSLDFEDEGRIAEGRAHLARVVERYPPGTPRLASLRVLLAGYARACRDWPAVLTHLAAAQQALFGAGGAVAREEHVLVALERSAYLIGVGLAEMAIPELVEARAQAEVLRDPGLLGDVLLEELNLANALGAYARLERGLAEARAMPWYGELPPEVVGQHELRAAVARAEHERLHPEVERLARVALDALVERDDLPPNDRALAALRLADLYLDEGLPARAAELADSLARQLGENCDPCASPLPSRLQIDHAVLRARLAREQPHSIVEKRKRLAEVREAFDSFLSRYRDAPLLEGGLGWMHTRDRLLVTEAYLSLLVHVEGPEASAEALVEVGRAQAVGSLARALGATAPSLAEIEGSLRSPGSGLLAIVPGAEHSHAFVLDDAGTDAFRLPSIYVLDPARRALVTEILLAQNGSPSPRLEETIRDLGHALLPPALAERIAGWKQLVVIGIDGLGLVPFELLELGDLRLGDRMAVSYVPSLPVGVALVRRRATRPGTSASPFMDVVVALEEAGRGDETSLRFGGWERAQLVDPLENVAIRLRTGHEAVPRALTDAHPGRAVLHVLAHGAPTDDPLRPRGLRLHRGVEGDSGLIDPADLEAIDMPPLVVLTACGAWSSPLRRGDDGRQHLAGAALMAGADGVVLSDFPLDYHQSLTLLGPFNSALARGLAPAHALLAARRAAGPEGGFPGRYLVHAIGVAEAPFPALAQRAGGKRVPLGLLAAGLLVLGAIGIRGVAGQGFGPSRSRSASRAGTR